MRSWWPRPAPACRTRAPGLRSPQQLGSHVKSSTQWAASQAVPTPRAAWAGVQSGTDFTTGGGGGKAAHGFPPGIVHIRVPAAGHSLPGDGSNIPLPPRHGNMFILSENGSQVDSEMCHFWKRFAVENAEAQAAWRRDVHAGKAPPSVREAQPMAGTRVLGARQVLGKRTCPFFSFSYGRTQGVILTLNPGMSP